MKFLKKLSITFMTICLAFVTFAGCSLVELDSTKYYNQVVANYNNNEATVTVKELLNGYYNFGNEQFDSSGEATVQGLEQTLKTLLNRKIMINTLKVGNTELGIEKITLTQKQINDAWQSTYDNINKAIKEVEDELRKADDASIPEAEEAGDTTVENYEKEYAPFDKTYTFENNILTKVTQAPETANHSIDVFQKTTAELDAMTESEKAQLAYDNFRENNWVYTDSKEIGNYENKTSYSDKAFGDYIKDLLKNETDDKLSDKVEDVFYRELDRLFEIYLDNQYLSAYQEKYTETSDTITEEMVLETYKNLVKASKEKYEGNLSGYVSDMKSNADTVFYNPYTSGNNSWFKVSHILIKYSDAQTSAMEKLKTKLDNNNITIANYKAQVALIKAQTTVTERYYENGVLKTGNTYSAQQVLNNLSSELSGKSYSQQMKIFNDYIYRFNMDEGVNNAKTCYYIPTNPENDQMVKSFADEARSLRTQGAGAVSSNLVESTYGYHIVFYIGETTQLDAGTTTLANLNSIYVNPFDEYATNGITQGKTLLDQVIEKISISNYSAHESNIIKQIIGDKSIVYDSIYKTFV